MSPQYQFSYHLLESPLKFVHGFTMMYMLSSYWGAQPNISLSEDRVRQNLTVDHHFFPQMTINLRLIHHFQTSPCELIPVICLYCCSTPFFETPQHPRCHRIPTRRPARTTGFDRSWQFANWSALKAWCHSSRPEKMMEWTPYGKPKQNVIHQQNYTGIDPR